MTSVDEVFTYDDYDRPFNTVEKNNCKILQYKLIGLNENHITVKTLNKLRRNYDKIHIFI